MPKHIHLYKSQKKSHGYIDGKVMPVFDNDNEDPNEKRTNSLRTSEKHKCCYLLTLKTEIETIRLLSLQKNSLDSMHAKGIIYIPINDITYLCQLI